MQRCLGPCAAALGYAVDANLQAAMEKTEDSLMSHLQKELGGGAPPRQSSPPTVQLEPEQKSGGVWNPEEGGGPLDPQAGQSSWGAESGVKVEPVVQDAQEEGQSTGLYDCRGQALLIGATVGRVVPGGACEDRLMVVTAGQWRVASAKAPSEEKNELLNAQSNTRHVALTLTGMTNGVNRGTKLTEEPVVGAFTAWKIVQGGGKDLFLPANVAAVQAAGKANVAGSPGAVAEASALLAQAARAGRGVQLQAGGGASGGGRVESVFEAAQAHDWSRTGMTEQSDANLNMCPGPSCPESNGATAAGGPPRKLMSFGNPFWKYVAAAALVFGFLSLRYMTRAASSTSQQRSYVQLPAFGSMGMGEMAGAAARPLMSEKRGAMPCPGQNAGERVVMVENASDRIIMVDVAGPASEGYQ